METFRFLGLQISVDNTERERERGAVTSIAAQRYTRGQPGCGGVSVCTSPGSAVGSADTGGDSAMAAAITSAASVAGLMAR
jgi:hypothetical protein